jgi:hypothetical protein
VPGGVALWRGIIRAKGWKHRKWPEMQGARSEGDADSRRKYVEEPGGKGNTAAPGVSDVHAIPIRS